MQLPYALAAGAARRWADKYRIETGFDPPQPTIDPAVQRVEVMTVEVPVPTRDWAYEAVQMSVAAVLGAGLAARATAVRLRRRRPPGDGLIEITDVVQPGTGPGRDVTWPA